MSQYVTTPDGRRHRLPDEASPDQIRAALSQYTRPDTTFASPLAMTAENNPATSFLSGLRGRALEALPSAGGFIGSYGGPGFAAIGGGAGEALRQYGGGAPFSPSQIGKRGAEEGAYSLVGGAIGQAAFRAASPLMRKALGIVPTLAKRFRTTPEAISEIVLSKRFPVTLAGERSAQAAGDVIRAARGARIGQVAGTIGAQRLATVALADASRAIGRPLTFNERRALVAKVQDEANAILAGRTHGVVPKAVPGTPAQPPSKLLDRFGQPAIPAARAIPPPPSRYSAREVEQIKEVAAKQARGAYSAEQAAMSVAADPTLSKQIAAGARSRLGRIPGVRGYNRELANMMSARQAISGALSKSSSEWTPLHLGPLSMGFKVPRDKIGGLSLILSDKRVQQYMRQSPRAVAFLIHEMLYTDQPDATEVAP